MQIVVEIGAPADEIAMRVNAEGAFYFFLSRFKERKRASARKIALRVCYGIANDDLGAINASRGISFSARQLYELSGAARVSARAREKPFRPSRSSSSAMKLFARRSLLFFSNA